MVDTFLRHVIDYSFEVIPAFLFALLISAVLTEVLPEKFFEKVLASRGIVAIIISSMVSALIPLCTCGMIPLASKLHKKGMSWPIVISFLTSGNACSITALFITLVLGWKIVILRFLFAVVFGILVAYIFVLFFHPVENNAIAHKGPLVCNNHKKSVFQRTGKEFLGLLFSFGPWILAAVLIASLISVFLKQENILTLTGASNIISPFLLSISSFPFYFCAGVDIPISRVLVEKGVPIGSVLAFMTASGGINLTSLLVYQRWLGVKNSFIYLGISFLICGFLGVIVNNLAFH